MRFVKVFVLFLFCAVLVSKWLTNAQSTLTIIGTTQRLTTDAGGQLDPAISGDLVVYTDQRNSDDIYFVNAATGVETPVSTSPFGQRLSDVSGTRIVYTDLTPPNRRIVLYDVVTGASSIVGTGTLDQNPRIDGQIVVFERDFGSDADIIAFNVATNTEIGVAETFDTEIAPSISGTRVVYEDHFSIGDSDIVLFDLTTRARTHLTTSAADERRPDIDGNLVVWDVVSPSGDLDIAIRNLSTGVTQVLTRPGNQRAPHVSGDFIAFDDHPDGNCGTCEQNVMLYHVPTGTFHPVAIQTNVPEFLNDISGNRIAYTSRQSENLDIWLYTFTIAEPEIEVTPLNHNFGNVALGASISTTIAVSNPGEQSLTLSGVAFGAGSSPAFTLTNSLTFPAVIAPGATLDVPIAFTPTAGGVATATLSVTSNDLDEAVVQVVLSGTGAQAPPVAICQNLTVGAGADCQAAVSAQEVGSVSFDPDGDAITLSLSPAGPFSVGIHPVTVTVTDSHGASASCNATVTVNDITPPVVSCNSNIVASAAAGQCSAAVNYSTAETDNCSGATVICLPASGSSFNIGTTLVECVASDAAGNEANCSFSVTVRELQPPTVACPPNVTAAAASGDTSAVVNYSQPQAADNCSGTAILCVPPSGSSFPPGSTTVICTATDASGNAAHCSFTVAVESNSPQADRIVFESNRDGNFEIYTVDADGANSTRLTFHPHSDINPAFSPDRSKIAFTSTRDGNAELYVMNADGTNQTRLTSTSVIEDDASWSPDGTKIAFWSSRDGNPEIYVMNADGTSQTRITSHSRSDTQPQWSPDGTRLVFVSNRNSLINFDIHVMNADGSNVTRLTTNLNIDESPDWSPDGSKIVFTSNRSNLLDFEIWVMNANGSVQSRLTTSTRSSVRPSWSGDGSEITFATNRHSLLNFEIYTMNPNGTNQTRLTTNSAVDFNPDR